MYDAQVLSPVMSTNAVPLVDQSALSAMTSKSFKKSQDEVLVSRGEVSKTSEMVQQKSESVRYILSFFVILLRLKNINNNNINLGYFKL